ncbi:MAG: arginine N-succinyltransferase [Thiomicrorhabdus chilensis]|uniref:arginine N-succinyltransferase n=1 Tax=Thiomicrorhabdus chilensis TaxID=63656 RepID=UPI00299EFD3A|nr:arginine N-succinyltransferase [Thiomicrorhabdus chilensis]MDX1346799.1 arginine N-succinyltransferase [Thiomicrorhabdus chilensis]
MHLEAKDKPEENRENLSSGVSPLKVVWIVLGSILLTIGLTYWILSQTIFLKSFTPIELKPQEEQVLNAKLKAVGVEVSEYDEQGNLKPEAYTEVGAKREVLFSERELNAMLAKNTDLAKKVAVDLSNDLLSVKVLVPMEEEFPVLGGKTLRFHAGAELAYRNAKPIVRLKGVSLMGVPIPNAWLGNLKNVDLVNEFGADPGFWKDFSEGVEDISVKEGELSIKLKE